MIKRTAWAYLLFELDICPIFSTRSGVSCLVHGGKLCTGRRTNLEILSINMQYMYQLYLFLNWNRSFLHSRMLIYSCVETEFFHMPCNVPVIIQWKLGFISLYDASFLNTGWPKSRAPKLKPLLWVHEQIWCATLWSPCILNLLKFPGSKVLLP